MKKTLTVSIAAYNMEKYIVQTLDSLIDEEVIDDLEIFVVDDGGNDQTLAIAQTYAERYPDSVFPVHKENGGYGTTVNYSMEHATGKYFKCLDGDDWFDAEGLKKLIKKLKEIETDVVIIPYFGGPDKDSLVLRDMPHIYNKELAISDLDTKQLPTIGMWALCYKTSVLKASGLKLPAHVFYTDQYFATIPFANAKTVCFMDHPLYCYRIGRDGQSGARNSRIKHEQEMLDICLDLCKFCAQQKEEDNPNYQYILHRVSGYHLTAIRTILLSPINTSTLNKLKTYEKKCRDISEDVYDHSIHMKIKSSMLLRLIRGTRYTAFWLLKLIPSGVPNF